MTLKQLVILIGSATLLLWLGWAWIIDSIDPFSTNLLGFVMFYLTLFLALCGTLSLATLYAKKSSYPKELSFHLVSMAFRQGVLLSAMITGLLYLQGGHLIRWWNIILLFAVVVMIEVVFLKTKRRPKAALTKSFFVDDQPKFNNRSL